MSFTDDESLECTCCNRLIYAGDDFCELDGEVYCSDDCVAEKLYKRAEKRIEYKRLHTAYERQMIYADMRADEEVENWQRGECLQKQ